MNTDWQLIKYGLKLGLKGSVIVYFILAVPLTLFLAVSGFWRLSVSQWPDMVWVMIYALVIFLLFAILIGTILSAAISVFVSNFADLVPLTTASVSFVGVLIILTLIFFMLKQLSLTNFFAVFSESYFIIVVFSILSGWIGYKLAHTKLK